ncbi:hypothetical protein LEP1GSC125_0307 [Leptospira mayottensis 200901122]|uniref:Uncharacterized protein n=1 Tax=Leptospira mayottensis 200901122 TaxID=1193010 RepID=A0AA87SXZ9_9LEPT|nr:hypothetical protein LEP1GSC125_0307 [Leptospira mayottensis 200901122]
MNKIYLQTQSHNNEGFNFSFEEKFYETSILILVLFSVLNFIFTFLLWKRK